MKKRLLVMLMALTFATTSLVGCSFSIGNESSGSSVLDELKDTEDEEDEDEDDKEDKKEKEDKENKKNNKKDKDNKEDKEDKDDKDEEDEKVVDKDWSKEYDNYFDQYSFEDGFEMSATTSEDGVDMDIVVGFAENDTYVSIGVTYEDNDPTRIDMYSIDDKVYVYAEMLGESQWTYAVSENEDEVEDLMGMSGEISEELDTSVFSNAVYEKEVEEDGIVYDILLLEEENSTSRFYIDRETQEIEKLVIDQDGEEVEYGLKDIDEIKLPKEAENATEVTMDDVGMTFMAVIFAAMGDIESEVEFTPETNVDTDTNVNTNVNIDANLNNPSFDENVTINGKTYTLGVSKPADVENGFGETFYDRDELELVVNPNYYESLFFYLGEDEKYTVWAYFANFTDEPQKLSDCTLYQITIEADGYTGGKAFQDDLSFVVGNAVTDDTKASELLAAFGEPSYTYHSDDYNLDDYEFDLPLGADYFDCLYELEVGYNAGGMYSFTYELR